MSSVFEKLEDVLPGYIDRIKNRTNTEDKIVHEFTYLIEKVSMALAHLTNRAYLAV